MIFFRLAVFFCSVLPLLRGNDCSERSEGKAKRPPAGQAAWFAGQVRKDRYVRENKTNQSFQSAKGAFKR
ncbi:hypothetical protein OA90_08560 [Labrenzia sp. OB1]|nr:hypothetical protein OA90_08560 [Labrenzia sp. OB1]